MNEPSASSTEHLDSKGENQKIKALPAAKSASKAAQKFAEKSAAIREDPLGDPGYLARFLIQCTLPHNNPGNVPVWKRKNGQYTLRIQPGWDDYNDCQMGYPYGVLPRLILIWAVTEAKRTGIRRLHLGHCLSEFIEKLDLQASGRGKRGDGPRLKEQARRLFSANIAFYRHTDFEVDKTKFVNERVRKASVAEDINLTWEKGTPAQAVLWGSWIDLSPHFFASIMDSTVPCDMRAVGMLRRSPLALDLYMLCNYIGANLTQRKKTKHLLTWRMLGQQLGCDYSDQDNLKKKIKAAMLKVKIAHPKLKVGYPAKGGGIEIYPSKPAIARRPAQPQEG